MKESRPSACAHCIWAWKLKPHRQTEVQTLPECGHQKGPSTEMWGLWCASMCSAEQKHAFTCGTNKSANVAWNFALHFNWKTCKLVCCDICSCCSLEVTPKAFHYMLWKWFIEYFVVFHSKIKHFFSDGVFCFCMILFSMWIQLGKITK